MADRKFQTIANKIINKAFAAVHPEIKDDFPNYPTNAPESLRFRAKRKKRIDDQNNNKNIAGEKKRSNRFTGDFGDSEIEKQIDSLQREPVFGSKKASTEKSEKHKTFVQTKLISPPKVNPELKRKKKVVNPEPGPSSSNENIGGIFSIHNGWDAEPTKPKIKFLEPPMMIENNYLVGNEACANAFEKYAASHGSSKRRVSTDSSSQSDDEIVLGKGKKVCKIVSSDEEQESTVVAEEKNENTLTIKNHDSENDLDEDVMDLYCDLDTLLEEDEQKGQHVSEIPPEKSLELVTELDGTSLKAYKKHKEIERENSVNNFHSNTKEISLHSVDPAISSILERVFENICPEFLEGKCKIQHNCTRNHRFPEVSSVKSVLMLNYNHANFQRVLEVVFKYRQLLAKYISIFADRFSENNDTDGLIKLIQGCEKYPRTRGCFRVVFDSLVSHKRFVPDLAIDFIIAHHKDHQSVCAQETILQLIFDNKTFIHHMDYVMKNSNQIGSERCGTLLRFCNDTFQNPFLPSLCIDILIDATNDLRQKLDKVEVIRFLNLQKAITDQISSYETTLKKLKMLAEMFKENGG